MIGNHPLPVAAKPWSCTIPAVIGKWLLNMGLSLGWGPDGTHGVEQGQWIRHLPLSTCQRCQPLSGPIPGPKGDKWLCVSLSKSGESESVQLQVCRLLLANVWQSLTFQIGVCVCVDCGRSRCAFFMYFYIILPSELNLLW